MHLRDLIRGLVPQPILERKRAVQRSWDLRRSIGRVRRLGAARDPAEALRMTKEFRGLGDYSRIDSVQIGDEICALFDLVRQHDVRCACEIGSFLGGTLCMMTRLLPEDAAIFSVDWPEVSDGPRPRASRKPFHEGFAREGQRVTVLYGDSHAVQTVEALETALAGRLLDFLFIDGDHSLEGVRADFELYSPLVREGGLIAFHDVTPNDGANFGVPEFWESIRDRYETVEFCDPTSRKNRGGFGIGVLFWPSESPV